MKLCKDCKHYSFYGMCVNPKLGADIVKGTVYSSDPHMCRHSTYRCGDSAKWWEPKDPPWYKVIFKRIFK